MLAILPQLHEKLMNMQTTFNKSDLLQFPNWIIDQWRFPDEDYFLIPSRAFPDTELRRVIHFLEDEKFKTDKGECVRDWVETFNPEKYDLVISPKQKIFFVQPIEDNDLNRLVKTWLTPELFKSMSILYSFNPFDKDHLADWLRQEKGIVFSKKPKKVG